MPMTDDLPPLVKWAKDNPPLPAIAPKMYLPTEVESMLRAYGAAREAAATERAAKVCDEHASIEGIAQACAAAIRQSQT